jgi:hypothetical protein
LTKWIHSLDVMAKTTRERKFLDWALDLANVTYSSFVVRDERRLYWKMSTDLSRPSVASSGLHDPVDGLATFLQLAQTARAAGRGAPLEAEIQGLASMCAAKHTWATTDELGIGGTVTR